MNPITEQVTQQVIKFLSQPELPFGAEEDILLLSDPAALQSRVAAMLEENPAAFDGDADELRARLSDADWTFIAQEFRARVGLASTFFDSDAKAAKEEISNSES